MPTCIRRPSISLKSLFRFLLLSGVLALSAASGAQTSPLFFWGYSPITFFGCVAFSPDSSKFVLEGSSGIQVFNNATGTLIGCLSTNLSDVGCVAFSPDGSLLAIGGINYAGSVTGEVELWDTAHWKLVGTIAPKSSNVNSVAFSPDSQTLVVGSSIASLAVGGQPLSLWNVKRRSFVAELGTAAQVVNAVRLSSDGKRLIVGGITSNSAVVEVWNLPARTVSQTVKTQAQTVNSVDISIDGSRIAVGGSYLTKPSYQTYGVLEVWNATTGKLLHSLGTAGTYIQSVQFSPDGTTLVNSANTGIWYGGGAEMWNVTSGKLIRSINQTPYLGVSSLTYEPDGRSILLGGNGYYLTSGQVYAYAQQWNASATSVKRTIMPAILTGAACSAFSLDGNTLTVAVSNTGVDKQFGVGALEYWDTATGKLLRSVDTSEGIRSIAYSSDRTVLADGGADETSGILELRDGTTGNLLTSLNSTPSHNYDEVALSPDGKRLAACGYDLATHEPILEIWSTQTRQQTYSLDFGDNVELQTISFSPDGSTIAVGGREGLFELWDAASGTQLAVLYPSEFMVNAIRFSPDGKTLCVAGVRFLSAQNATCAGAELWDVASLTRLADLPIPTTTSGGNAVAFSADGKEVYVSMTSEVDSYSTESYRLLGAQPLLDPVSLTFSPKGSYLAFTSYQMGPRLGLLTNPIAGLRVSVNPIIGGKVINATVTLSEAAPTGGLEVALESSDGHALVSSSVLVPPGSKTATFPIQTVGVTATVNPTITAQVLGFSQSLDLEVRPPAIVSLKLKPTSVVGGQSSLGTITMSAKAPTGGLVVNLSGSSTAALVPQTVTVPAGSTSVTFTITTKAVTRKSSAVITAVCGPTNQSATLTVH